MGRLYGARWCLAGLLGVVLGIVAPGITAAEAEGENLMQTRHTFSKRVGWKAELGYLMYLPKDYRAKSSDSWPLVLFLHGAGERGESLKKVAVHGPPKLVEQKKEFPFILVSPQCPAGRVWSSEELIALLDEVERKYRVDKRRVYVTGLSMGGYGTWDLVMRYPDRFAAAAPICGGGDYLRVLLPGKGKEASMRSLPIWAFHGAKDTVVPVAESERMVEALKRAGARDVRLTIYSDADHDSWTRTYENPEFYTWLLSQSRKR